MRQTVYGVIALSALFSVTPGQAYEDDVHYGLTRWLASKAGFLDSDAEVIAKADVQIDGGFLDAIPRVFTSSCLLRADALGANKVRENHFATEVPAPDSPAARAVTAGNDYASNRAKDRINKPSANRLSNLLEFGERVHAFEDTWSHAGEPDIPGIWPLRCRKNYAWGHPKARGGWLNHAADLTASRPSDALEMAKATLELMCQFRDKVDNAPCPKRLWEVIRNEIELFNSLGTKIGKRDWFEKRGFKNVRFVERTSLPESDKPVPLPYLVAEPLSSMAAVGKDEISQFFARFFGSWATATNFDALGEVFADQKEFGVDANAERLVSADKISIRLTLQFWRALDHGRVASLGHRVSLMSSNSRSTLTRMLDVRGMLEPYRSPDEAFQPMNEERAPFVVIPAPSPSGQTVYLALARFRHAPKDTVVVSAQRTGKELRINAIQSLLEY